MSLPRLRAPQNDGQFLIHPPLTQVGAILESNRKRLPPVATRRQAIAEITQAAREYLVASGEPVPDFSSDSLIVAGHQPDLFHPGVWLKNFAIYSLARQHGVTPINLVVDNDVVKSTTLRVPRISDDPAELRLASLPFDDPAAETTFEERPVHNESLYASLPQRLAECTANWPFQPIGTLEWPECPATPNCTLGERFVAARRALERGWGCHNLELPLSRLCGTESFAAFAMGIVTDLPAFQSAYNEAVHDYRLRHGIRNAFHPVPDLGRDGDWLEAPFWAWRRGQTRRSRLFVRQNAGRLEVRVGGEAWPDLPLSNSTVTWRKLEAQGFKVRTRALTTTLFSRLFLADLFVHGIGGGKYDEVTDALIARHWHVEPPAFLIATGTLRLPLPRFRGTAQEFEESRRLVRDLEWNPQRHLTNLDSGATRLQQLISVNPEDHAAKRERFHAIREHKSALQSSVANRLPYAIRRTERLEHEVAANAILGRRDYSFALFPAELLRHFFGRIKDPGAQLAHARGRNTDGDAGLG